MQTWTQKLSVYVVPHITVSNKIEWKCTLKLEEIFTNNITGLSVSIKTCSILITVTDAKRCKVDHKDTRTTC